MAKTKQNNTGQIDWPAVARIMLTSRTIDEIEENELVKAGKVTYQFSAKGHELSQVLLGLHMNHPHDGATVYYRSRPFMLATGLTPQEAFSADMARTGSSSEGRDVGVVYSMPPRNGPTVLPSSGDVGAQYTPAAGWAQAIQYYQKELRDKEWESAMAVCLGGDGSVASNGFWSALTIATTLQLPLLFFIEDNGYGISVPRHFQTPGGNIADNLGSFKNLHIIQGSGTQPEVTANLIEQAASYVRKGNGPCLLRMEVVRLTGHTFGEDQTAYKSDEQIEEERQRDPLKKTQDFLGKEFDWEALVSEVESEVRAQLASAEANPEPDPNTVAHHTHYNIAPVVPPQDDAIPAPIFGQPQPDGPRINLSESIRRTIESELQKNPKLLVFGEDVGPRGGVHRVTVDLQSKFGEQRVFDTSLSEEGIMGRAVGMALAGLRPLPEIQFRKYADPAHEQIHDTGWVRWRTAGKFAAPVVMRVPVGYSKKTGDPWHSVSAEASYAHMIGWRIAMPSNAEDAAGLLRTALREQEPTIFMEHRALYDNPVSRTPFPGDDFCLPFGKANIIQSGTDLTVVTWGEMVYRCIEATDKFAGAIEIIDLRTIQPWDQETVLSSIERTGKCAIVHEDTLTGGFGGEIAAIIAEHAFTHLDAPIQRIATIDTPIPFNIQLMIKAVIPNSELLQTRFENLLNW